MSTETVGADSAVYAQGIQHRYHRIGALNGIDLDIAAGSSIALVGPDGVGKSTLLGLIAGVKRLQHGTLTVFGGDMGDDPVRERLQNRIAYMPQGLGRNLYPNLTVQENVGFFARLFNHPDPRTIIDELLNATGLAPFRNRLMRNLSGGMKQKLGLCCSLVHTPDLLILDEPTTGIDPLSRREFWELVETIRRLHPGLTLLVATADMVEATRFGHVALIDRGRFLAQGSPAELLARTGTDDLEAAYIALLPPERRDDSIGLEPAQAIAADADIAIESRGLTRRFGDFVAVDAVSFSIRRGEIFGFLGSNGCGKTTTMKMLTGLLPASAGEALLLGRPVDPRDLETRKRVGYMSQSFSLYAELTVRQNLNLHAQLFALDASYAQHRIETLIATYDLAEVIDLRAEQLPLGVRQRLSLAVAVLHEPEVLILDEPTSGVDPVARNRFWRDLQHLARDQGVTIFISTHYMGEAGHCDRVAFMHAGRVIATGSPAELQASQGVTSLEDAFIAFMQQGGRHGADIELDLPDTGPLAVRRGFSLRRLRAYAWREAAELLRDHVRLAFSLLGTALLMLIFGFGITLDVDDLHFAVLDHDQTPESRAFIDEFAHSSYFKQGSPLRDQNDINRRLRSNRIALALEIPPRFGADLHAGRPVDIAVTVDGAMPFRAETILGYVQGVNQHFLTEYGSRVGIDLRPPATVEMRFRFNQAFRSIDAMVPSVIALLLVFIPPMLTSLAVVNEKEQGSITNLYVTPVTRLEFLLGKQLPYVALAMFNFLVMLLLAVFVFRVVPSGSMAGLALAALAYVISTTAIGLVSSTLTHTQIAALVITALITIIPAIQFAGFLQPVAALDGVSHWVGVLFPTTYFLRACVGAFAKALDFAQLLPFTGTLLLFWPALMLAAYLMLPKQEP